MTAIAKARPRNVKKWNDNESFSRTDVITGWGRKAVLWGGTPSLIPLILCVNQKLSMNSCSESVNTLEKTKKKAFLQEYEMHKPGEGLTACFLE